MGICLAPTQVELSSIHEGPVPDGSVFGIGMPVAICKESRGNEGDRSKEDDAERAEDPPELSHAPSQRQHTCPYHPCYYMCHCCPSCTLIPKRKNKNQQNGN